MHTVLLVEDDQELAGFVRDYLSQYGYCVQLESCGSLAIGRILQESPDAVILDVNLPGSNGFEVCKAVRSRYPGVILMLTARLEDVDEVLGLENGADDYLAKPIRPSVLLARMKLHLRRQSTTSDPQDEAIRAGGLILYPQRRSVELRGQLVKVSGAEFDLLLILAEQKGSIVTRMEIHKSLHPAEEYDYRSRWIDLRVSRLRRKLEDDPAHPVRIKSVWGDGYMLSVEP
jgi:two-component system response regulator RstA